MFLAGLAIGAVIGTIVGVLAMGMVAGATFADRCRRCSARVDQDWRR